MNTPNMMTAGRLVLGSPDDPAEFEAHRAADAVATGGTARVVRIARPARTSGLVDPLVQQRIARAFSQGEPLPDADRELMERGFGADLGEVRLHTGVEASDLCRAVRARAFTVGRHVFVGAEYRPGTELSRRLLAHELAHVLQEETGVVRRTVWAGTGVALSEPKVKKYAQGEEGGQLVANALNAGVDVDTLIKSFVTSGTDYYLVDVYKEIKRQTNAASFQDDMALGIPGVAMQYKSLSAEGVSQQFAATVAPDRVDVHPGQIAFKATMAVRLDHSEIGQWTLGVVQNVLWANRVVSFIQPDQSIRKVTMAVDAQTNDRREDGVTPWYDKNMSSNPLGLDYQEADVILDDRPGFWLDIRNGEQFHDLAGTDMFRTWLILRHNSGAPIHWLYHWDWQIDYTAQGGAVSLSGENWYPDGSDAVLSGPRASQAVAITETIEAHDDGCDCVPNWCNII